MCGVVVAVSFSFGFAFPFAFASDFGFVFGSDVGSSSGSGSALFFFVLPLRTNCSQPLGPLGPGTLCCREIYFDIYIYQVYKTSIYRFWLGVGEVMYYVIYGTQPTTFHTPMQLVS